MANTFCTTTLHSSSAFDYFPGTFHETSPNFGMASCTESLGFESSNLMVSDSSCDCCTSNRMMMSEDSKYGERKQRRSPLPENEFDFPPPLSSLSENGRRSFTLKRIRNNGRLKIVKVSIDQPTILYSSRRDGRLRLHLVTIIAGDEEGEEEEGEQERENEENEDETTDANEDGETTAAATVEEEREWKIPAIRRCSQREILYVWGQQQNRCVTTM